MPPNLKMSRHKVPRIHSKNVFRRKSKAPGRSHSSVDSDDKYQRFIENLPVLFYAVQPSPPFSPIYVSPAFERFGYSLADWRTDPNMWLRVIHPDDQEWVFNATQTSTETGKTVDYEFRIVALDGSIHWIRDRGCLIRGADGYVALREGVMIDITDRKHADVEVQKREKLYRTLAHSIPRTAVLLFDHDLRYSLADGEQLAKHEFSPGMFEGKTLFEVFPPEIANEYVGYYRRALAGERISFDHEVDSGSYQIHILPVKDEHGEIFAGMVMWQDITEAKKAETDLRESEERYRDLFENANDIIYVHDLEGNYLSVNKAAERILGYTRDEALATNMREIAAPEHIGRVHEQLAKKRTGEARQTAYEIDCIRKDGTRLTLEVNSSLILKDGEPVAVQGIARDVTERNRTEAALKASEAQYRELFENANDLIYTHDLKGNFLSINRAGENITGYSRTEATELNVAKVVAPEFLELASSMTARKLAGEKTSTYELEINSKGGRRVSLELNTSVIFEAGIPVGIQGIGRDVSERKHAEAQLRYYARHDTLTDLPNRAAFMDELKKAIGRIQGGKNGRMAVLFLDLDRFKVINDSLGHVVGDKLLVSIAERLRSCVRPGDVVARLGGDEFTILLNRTGNSIDVERVAERVQAKVSEPFQIDNYEVFTSASVGIVIADGVSREPEDFLRDADAAMYRAKELGKARYEVFDSEMYVRNMNLLRIENDLRHAVDRGEFEVHYQPLIDIRDGSISEFEALLRWRHPERGLMRPDEWVSVAEETGLIIPIGGWILEESCREIAEWQKLTSKRLAISVNLSAKQLMHPTLPGEVADLLTKYELRPEQLNLEVTESTVMENAEKALSVLKNLEEMGVALSTDDFGTGYSSLSYLQRFPFKRLKIDRSFIDLISKDEKSWAIVRTIIVLGENLDIEVVAEGIETEDQLKMLRAFGCHLGQGFLFSRPVAAIDARAMIETGQTMTDEGFFKSQDIQDLINPSSPAN